MEHTPYVCKVIEKVTVLIIYLLPIKIFHSDVVLSSIRGEKFAMPCEVRQVSLSTVLLFMAADNGTEGIIIL